MSSKSTTRESRSLRAKYDSAQTTDSNQRYWSQTDRLSAAAANLLPVRKMLRERGRYEVYSNSYLKGIRDTVTLDTVGTGPTLDMGTNVEELDNFIEKEFTLWARRIGLAARLRTMRATRFESGEAFVLLVTNPMLDSPVKLDLDIKEADQVTDPTWTSAQRSDWDDGIHYDQYGNPISYRILRQHPGAANWSVNPFDYVDYPARSVFHYFRCDRPGQQRGIPDITPALSVFPELRRYCAAVIAAAETAASFAAVAYTEAPPEDGEETTELKDMELIELTKGMGTILPKGYKLGQIQAEQPTTTYDTFVNKKLSEAARCIQVPFTIAALDSSSSNLSARYLDSQIYARSIIVERTELEVLLDRLLDEWLTEAMHIPGYLPEAAAQVREFSHAWSWPTTGQHADPDKVASAAMQRLQSGLSTLGDEWAQDGKNWSRKQQEAARQLGMSVEEYQAALRFAIFGTDPKAPQQGANGAKENQPANAPLNGAQITAAIELMVKLREKVLAPEAAAELLVGLGIEKPRAQAIVKDVPEIDSAGGDVAFQREILKKLLDVPAAREGVYNGTNILDLITQSGLPIKDGYQAPLIPIVAPAGPLVSGEELKNKAGQTVGGDLREQPAAPAPATKPATPPTPPGEEQEEQEEEQGDETLKQKRGVMATLASWLGIGR